MKKFEIYFIVVNHVKYKKTTRKVRLLNPKFSMKNNKSNSSDNNNSSKNHDNNNDNLS